MARTQCGGVDQLDAAVHRKQVKKVGQPGQELYYFPKQSVGKGQEWKATEIMDRQQESTAGAFADYAASMDSLMGTNAIGGSTDVASSSTDVQLLALMSNPGACGPQQVSGVVDSTVLKDKKARLMAAIGLSEKITSKIDGHSGSVPERVSLAAGVLLSLAEQADHLVGDIGFLVKYGKTPGQGGKLATHEVMEQFKVKADKATNQILEEVKVIRAIFSVSIKV